MWRWDFSSTAKLRSPSCSWRPSCLWRSCDRRLTRRSITRAAYTKLPAYSCPPRWRCTLAGPRLMPGCFTRIFSTKKN